MTPENAILCSVIFLVLFVDGAITRQRGGTMGVLTAYFVGCDDPHDKGCKATTKNPCFNKDAVSSVALKEGFHFNDHSGKWSCPSCNQIPLAIPLFRKS